MEYIESTFLLQAKLVFVEKEPSWDTAFPADILDGMGTRGNNTSDTMVSVAKAHLLYGR